MLTVVNAGPSSSVQDLGRWGYQKIGVSVSGAMDPFSLRMGLALIGGDEDAAAIEATLPGLSVVVGSPRCVALVGADLGMTIDRSPAAAWTVHEVAAGSRISLTSLADGMTRGYLCFSGGIDIPRVMGSRSTHARAKIGGIDGRTLKNGDTIPLGEPDPLWRYGAGASIPHELRTTRYKDDPIFSCDGPQVSHFTDAGISKFYSSTYKVTSESDRMGCRLDGPIIETKNGSDIISDAIPLGAVQVPSSGKPIVMLADRQTTGGYAKIAVVTYWSTSFLAQKMPGSEVRFERVTRERAISFLERYEQDLESVRKLRATYRSRRCI